MIPDKERGKVRKRNAFTQACDFVITQMYFKKLEKPLFYVNKDIFQKFCIHNKNNVNSKNGTRSKETSFMRNVGN